MRKSQSQPTIKLEEPTVLSRLVYYDKYHAIRAQQDLRQDNVFAAKKMNKTQVKFKSTNNLYKEFGFENRVEKVHKMWQDLKLAKAS